jgi:hypothetical protein
VCLPFPLLPTFTSSKNKENRLLNSISRSMSMMSMKRSSPSGSLMKLIKSTLSYKSPIPLMKAQKTMRCLSPVKKGFQSLKVN